MTPAGWSPVDQALMHAARVPDTQSRLIEARDRLTTRARQRYSDALKPLKRTHPQRAAWSVAQVAAANAREWADRGYPSGGDGGRSSGHRDLSDVIGKQDPAADVAHRAHQATWRVMRAVELTQWPNAYNALCDLLAIMEEAAGLAPMPAPDDLNTTDPCCENHAKVGKWAAPSVKRAGLTVCRYCADAHRSTGQWPDSAWLAAADAGDQRTIRRLRTAAMQRTEAEAKEQRTGRWFGAGDLALGVREVR